MRYINGPQPPVRGPVPVRGSVGAGPHKDCKIVWELLLFHRHTLTFEIRNPEIVWRGHFITS